MENWILKKKLRRIRDLLSKTTATSAGDLELQAHWARYICILAAGFLENSIQVIYSEFVKRVAPEPVASYACQRLSKIQNPKTSRFLEIAGAFKAQWRAELEEYVDKDGRREAIDSIMNNRHQIAHGKNVGITIAQVREYLGRSVEVIDFIESQVKS